MSSNFELNVRFGEGLSYAIDRALDNVFGQDIKLKKVSQWQSIFNIITSEPQAEQTQANQKQFSSNDNDVKNYSHYAVHEGVYNLTQSTWNKIVSFISQELNLTPANNGNEENLTDKVETQEVKSYEECLRELLNETGIELDDNEFLDVLSKYENKLALKNQGLDISDEQINTDILAYISGKKYEKTEDVFISQNGILHGDQNATKEVYELDGVKQALEYAKQHPEDEEGAYKQQSDGYIQFGNSQLQLYDKSGDNKVDFNEFIEYEQQRNNIEFSEEEKAAIHKIFEHIAQDDYIDLKEFTLHGYALSKITDSDEIRTGDSISYNDWFTTQEIIAGIGTDNNSPNHVKAKNRYDDLVKLGQEVVYNYKAHL